MAKVRSLESRVRNGALLAGIPLLMTGFVPYSLDPLWFSWNIARETDQLAPLIAPAAGLMTIAVGVVPGLPRIARALLMMIFAGVAGYFLFDLLTDTNFGRQDYISVGTSALKEPRVLLFLGTIAAAAVFELAVQAKKASKLFAFLALLSWGGFLSNFFVPVAGEMPITSMIETVTESAGIDGDVILALSLACIFLLLSFFGVLFAFLRLVRSQEGMLRGPWRSSWSGILMGGAFGWVTFVVVGAAMIAGENYDAATVLFNGCAVLWGVGLGLTAGFAHTLLGFAASAPLPARGFKPAPVSPPPAGSTATLMDASAPQPFHPAAAQAYAPQVQRVPAPQPTPAIQPAPVEPASAPRPLLEPYPGYPGYFICPNSACRGGISPNDNTCPHCGQPVP